LVAPDAAIVNTTPGWQRVQHSFARPAVLAKGR
jgi:hypothetical protein